MVVQKPHGTMEYTVSVMGSLDACYPCVGQVYCFSLTHLAPYVYSACITIKQCASLRPILSHIFSLHVSPWLQCPSFHCYEPCLGSPGRPRRHPLFSPLLVHPARTWFNEIIFLIEKQYFQLRMPQQFCCSKQTNGLSLVSIPDIFKIQKHQSIAAYHILLDLCVCSFSRKQQLCDPVFIQTMPTWLHLLSFFCMSMSSSHHPEILEQVSFFHLSISHFNIAY